MLAVRTVTAAEADAADDQTKQQQQEFYVKWRGRSYIHCSWIPEAAMNAAAAVRVIGQPNPVATRLRKFWREKWSAAESGEIQEAEETGALIHGINPAWLQVTFTGHIALQLYTARGTTVLHTSSAAVHTSCPLECKLKLDTVNDVAPLRYSIDHIVSELCWKSAG